MIEYKTEGAMHDHKFEIDQDGKVSCLICFCSDDEMEQPDFWSTQVSFE